MTAFAREDFQSDDEWLEYVRESAPHYYQRAKNAVEELRRLHLERAKFEESARVVLLNRDFRRFVAMLIAFAVAMSFLLYQAFKMNHWR